MADDKSCKKNIQVVSKKEHEEIHQGIDWASGKDINSLLVIELEDETSVPKVFYKGEEIKNKQNIFLDWDSETDTDHGGLSYAVEHTDQSKGYPVTNRIERKVKGHAY